MQARVGKPETALENLKNYMDCTSRNGFHQNGVQTRKDLPAYNMRAFTLEGNFAAGQAVNEMLLQSWGGRIRIFPAVPEKWSDVSFEKFRTEGGFIVSAERKQGKTVKVTITATVNQSLRLKNPFGNQKYESNVNLERNNDDDLSCYLKKGQTLVLKINEK
jgi:alpha-L-fucosidase 2